MDLAELLNQIHNWEVISLWMKCTFCVCVYAFRCLYAFINASYILVPTA